MPLEKLAYRDNLERLCEVFPNGEMLNMKQVKEFTGLSYPTVAKMFSFKNKYISKATLARELS